MLRLVVIGMSAAGLVAAAPATAKKPPKLDPDRLTPLIFIHGASGSAGQF